MRRSMIAAPLLAFALTLPPVGAAAQSKTVAVTKAAPVADLVNAVNIPYEQFTLANGLRVLVHTDRKAPVVGVTVYYRVGSRHEPKGKTGFAHLFEHLMFGGSENVPSFDKPLAEAGSTASNGSTWFDRTNYVVTVPTGALDLALFMEADRMGRLLGAVTQAKLDAQRAVVQNEKRQGDNQPYGLVEYAQLAALFPDGHPYAHSTIGSMADLDAASLDDVKSWFRDNYGPNNAILVVAGDIDLATARAKVEAAFGSIARGQAVKDVVAPVPSLAKRVDQVMKDRVALTRIYRNWTTPGLNDPDAPLLTVGMGVLGGLASSRLDNALVRGEQIAVAVTAGLQQFEQVGMIEVTADVKPGVDPALVEKRVDELIAELIAKGPSADEVRRVATRQAASEIAALEVVGGFGGKATTLAEGLLYSGDPAQYKKTLTALANATPQAVQGALQRWIKRPAFALRVEPGERDAYADALVGAPDADKPTVEVVPPTPTLALPKVGPNPALDFPAIETGRLANGIAVHVARRTAVPAVQIALSFDAGIAADPADQRGIGRLMLGLLEEGTRTRNSIQIAEEQERLGANIGTGQTADRAVVTLFALKPNLAPSLDLLSDVVRNPAFAPVEVERLRAIQLAGIAQERTSPQGMAQRAIYPLLYGPAHPYGVPASGNGDEASVKAVTPARLAAHHRAWLRPERAEIFVVGDTSLAEIRPLLDARFGKWPSNRMALARKAINTPASSAKPGIYLIDRPQSPQSIILSGTVTAVAKTDDLVAFEAANTVVANDFLSRLNTDIRETKGWSYGVNGRLARREGPSPYIVSAPVQADKTGPAISAMQGIYAGFLGKQGVSAEEFNRVVKGEVAQMPAQYETSAAVLGQMQADRLYGRPFDYAESLAQRFGALTPASMDAAARQIIDPATLRWVVVGDAKAVLPQLEPLGMPVIRIDSDGRPTK